jgi:hypothetical protein
MLDDTLKKWLTGDIDCVVATIAFGMVRARPLIPYGAHSFASIRELTNQMCVMSFIVSRSFPRD